MSRRSENSGSRAQGCAEEALKPSHILCGHLGAVAAKSLLVISPFCYPLLEIIISTKQKKGDPDNLLGCAGGQVVAKGGQRRQSRLIQPAKTIKNPQFSLVSPVSPFEEPFKPLEVGQLYQVLILSNPVLAQFFTGGPPAPASGNCEGSKRSASGSCGGGAFKSDVHSWRRLRASKNGMHCYRCYASPYYLIHLWLQ